MITSSSDAKQTGVKVGGLFLRRLTPKEKIAEQGYGEEQPIGWDATALTRAAALENKFKYYFTGEPCKKGHVAKRYAVNGECWDCRQEWRKKKRDVTNAKQNKDRLHERTRLIREKNAKDLKRRCEISIRKHNKEHGTSYVSFLTGLGRLPSTDDPIPGEHGELLVKCYKCRNHFHPKSIKVSQRIAAFEGRKEGESNFYCSTECLNSCPVYNSRPKIIQASKKNKRQVKIARSCQLTSKKILIAEQVAKNCFTFCERCGREFGSLHLHHTIMVSEDAIKSINQNGHIVVCEECHRIIHKSC